MFPNMTKEQVEQKYQDCGCDIHRTISVILDGASNDGKYIIRVLHVIYYTNNECL